MRVSVAPNLLKIGAEHIQIPGVYTLTREVSALTSWLFLHTHQAGLVTEARDEQLCACVSVSLLGLAGRSAFSGTRHTPHPAPSRVRGAQCCLPGPCVGLGPVSRTPGPWEPGAGSWSR